MLSCRSAEKSPMARRKWKVWMRKDCLFFFFFSFTSEFHIKFSSLAHFFYSISQLSWWQMKKKSSCWNCLRGWNFFFEEKMKMKLVIVSVVVSLITNDDDSNKSIKFDLVYIVVVVAWGNPEKRFISFEFKDIRYLIWCLRETKRERWGNGWEKSSMIMKKLFKLRGRYHVNTNEM